jgi:hypothetical protein
MSFIFVEDCGKELPIGSGSTYVKAMAVSTEMAINGRNIFFILFIFYQVSPECCKKQAAHGFSFAAIAFFFSSASLFKAIDRNDLMLTFSSNPMSNTSELI